MQNRLGRFSVTEELIRENSEGVRQVLGRVLVLRATEVFHNRSIEYIAMSEMFDEVPPGEEIPEYMFKIFREADGTISAVEAIRQ